MPAISVIMPVYNAKSFLREAVESILNQSLTDFEFLIIDDGSSDGSKEIVKSYDDPRIECVDYAINQGYPTLLNIGLRQARGKYVARMDADDISHPDRLKKQYEFLESNPDYILCGARYSLLGSAATVLLPITNDDIKLKMLYITPFCHPTVMIRNEVLQKNALSYNVDHMPAEDHELWVRLSDYGKFYNLPEPLLKYRVHGNNISLQNRTAEQRRNLYNTQLDYINKFFSDCNIQFSEATTLHKAFFKDRYTYHELLETGDIVNKIVGGNYHFPVPAIMIKKLLAERFFYNCTISTHLGIRSFVIANRYAFTKASLISMLKLFVKAILRYSVKSDH